MPDPAAHGIDVISFIVPAYNEEQLLPRTLRALHAAAEQVGEPYEVIVVDDASTDRTATIAVQGGARVVHVEHRQIARTRNAGARIARGERLVFVDADTVVSATVLRAAFEALRSGVTGGGAAVRFDGRVPLYAKVMMAMLLNTFRVQAFRTLAALAVRGPRSVRGRRGLEMWYGNRRDDPEPPSHEAASDR